MTGHQLYSIYEDKMDGIQIPVEKWEELKESEQQVWEYMASKLRGTS